ncbi:MAG TPA: ComEC/Rec2 family competence protein, partial [Synergistetes bacterium]|nr:ComEC/Rec2 family competence protein [Synergistota bacterium]
VLMLSRLEPERFEPRRISTEGTVIRERSWGRGRVILLDSPPGKLVVHLFPSALFREGEKVEVQGVLDPFLPEPGSDGFDEGTYWLARGALGIIRHGTGRSAGEMSMGISRWRELVRERILRRMPPMMRGHLLAAWLGDRDPDLALRHSSWGTSHVLAVSGLHVGIVVMILFALLPVRFFRLGISSLFMWLYILFAGASSSSLRAGLMIQTGFSGKWKGRPLQAVNTVSVAGLLLIFWRPWLFWDLGWRLSMTAALVLSSFQGTRSWKVWILAPLLLWVSTAGMVSEAFGMVPVAGIVINVIAVPLFGLLLPGASLLALPALLGVPGGVIVAWTGEMLFRAWEIFADGIVFLLPWHVPYSAGLSAAGMAAALCFVLRGAGFRWFSAVLFSGVISLFFMVL